MPINRKTAKQKRLTQRKGNPAQNPRKRKRADDVFRQRAKPTTDDLTERFNHRSPTRVPQIPELPSKEKSAHAAARNGCIKTSREDKILSYDLVR